MPNFVPVSQERHAGKGWKKPDGYAFALKQESVPLVGAEMASAASSVPIIFTQQGEDFSPAAMMGIGTGRNLFMTQAGKWLGGYVPALLCTHPFRLGLTPQGKSVLCVDEESGLIEEANGATPFFGEDGKPSPPLQEAITLLGQLEHSRIETEKAMKALRDAGLLKPWPIKVQTPDGEKSIQGIFQLDETALRKLPSEPLVTLHAAGALEIAYSHLVSRQHVKILSHLLQAHEHRDQALRARTKGILVPDESPDIQIDWDRLSKQ